MAIPFSAADPAAARPMLADLRRQAEVLQQIAARAAEFRAHGAGLAAGGVTRWCAFGSGDGWFAARAAQDYATRTLGLRFDPSSSLELLAYGLPRWQQDRVAAIAISMSGTADRTNQAAQALRQAGQPVLALSNGSGGDLARIADGMVSLGIADLAPFLTGTTKYSATLLALLLILEGAAGQTPTDWPQFLGVLPDLLERAEAFAGVLGEAVAARAPSGLRLLGAGPNLATSEYGMAKCIKLLGVPVWSDEVEEFAHRQFWTCPASDLVIYVATHPVVARCASASAEALGSMGMTTVAIDTPDAPVIHARHRFTLPACEESRSPLLAAVPLQFLAYGLALALGGQPDQSQDVSDPARFRAAQMLARRSELG